MRMIIDRQPGSGLDQETLSRITDIIGEGGLIVYPTTNLYGLGAGISSANGMANLIKAKRRPGGMPISIMVDREQIGTLCELNELANEFIEKGSTSLTAVLPASDNAPGSIVFKGTIAVRLPCSELTRSLVETVGPITATSANIHGREAPFTIEDAEFQLGDDVSLYLNGGKLGGTPTTLVDLTGQQPKVLREGLIPANEVHDIYGR